MVFLTGADVLGIFLGRGKGGLAFTFGAVPGATGGAFTGGLSGGAVSSGALCAGSGDIQQLSEPLDLLELVQRLNHSVEGDPINDVHPQPQGSLSLQTSLNLALRWNENRPKRCRR